MTGMSDKDFASRWYLYGEEYATQELSQDMLVGLTDPGSNAARFESVANIAFLDRLSRETFGVGSRRLMLIVLSGTLVSLSLRSVKEWDRFKA